MREIKTESERFTLTSWGHGASLALLHKESGWTVHLQGDDAAQFFHELENLERVQPSWSADQLLGWMWSECGYVDAATAPEGAEV